jgi:hypothetical protein
MQEIVPAPCFDCGTSGVRCQTYAEYCRITTAALSSSAACASLPASCQPVPSCACLTTQPNCSQADGGALTVMIQAP